MKRVVLMCLICYVAIVLLGIVYSRASTEAFVDPDMDPAALFKRARDLLDKYDKPDVWNHSAQMLNKDPGELARLQLGIRNHLR